MSSQSSRFEFRWQSSRLLAAFYLGVQLLALAAVWGVEIALWAKSAATLLCLLHAARVCPRYIALSTPEALTALRRIDDDWQLWSAAQGWQSIKLLPDSVALPWLITLRFCWLGKRMPHSICIPCDSMSHAEHRRLRVRLKFSPRRWAAAE